MDTQKPASQTQVFDWELQRRFAEFSGDCNPMHMDAIAARRTQAGEPVVHGVHAVLWALETLADGGRLHRPITEIKVRFQKLIYVGDTVTVNVLSEDAGALRASLMADGVAVTLLQIAFGEPITHGLRKPVSLKLPAASWPDAPLDPSLTEMAQANGWLSFAQRTGAAAHWFPKLTEATGPARVSALACMSRLVGMVCPGLYSIFATITVNAIEATDGPDAIHYQAEDMEERFRLVKQSVEGGGWTGEIESFVRIPPVVQPSMEVLAKVIGKEEFKNSDALVIGGSRGLGELTAKLIAVGGGRVVISFAVGQADALEVQRQIQEWGGQCEIMKYDVNQPASSQLSQFKGLPTSVYYFATSFISRRKLGLLSQSVLHDFLRVYVDGFYDLCQTLSSLGGVLTAFYPSSVFVENRPTEMTEYAMAKAAGEVLCADLTRFNGSLHVVSKRLPRMLTDQTATVMPIKTEDSLAVMIPVVREIEGSISSADPLQG